MKVPLSLCLERKVHPPPMGISSEPALSLPEANRTLWQCDRNRLPWSVPVRAAHCQDLGPSTACSQWLITCITRKMHPRDAINCICMQSMINTLCQCHSLEKQSVFCCKDNSFALIPFFPSSSLSSSQAGSQL